MFRSWKAKLMLMLMLTTVLLLAGMAGVSYGARRIPGLDATAVGGGSPPAKGVCFLSRQAPSDSVQHVGDGFSRMRGVSKRLVPQGPNPLHN
ncbi:hypothetical protein GUJ93_ZPchr0012g19017 [Zizania palustris]|uniref:Uncharacterized protein n=1 Tax=Zizania palustris TaxID=103762 RepID=A0A8J5WIA3_ZIZPA|nr:hypothetical protein GUJ93_ZPchr0012g19017 [Zizania palustris]